MPGALPAAQPTTVPVVTSQNRVVSPVGLFSAAPTTVDDAFLHCSHDDVILFFFISSLQLFHCLITYDDEYHGLQRDAQRTLYPAFSATYYCHALTGVNATVQASLIRSADSVMLANAGYVIQAFCGR